MTKKKAKTNTSRATSSAAARQKLYIEAMLQTGGNKRASGLAAGCKSERAADQYATRMSQIVEVTAEIDRRQAEVLAAAQAETGVSITATLRELAGIMHLDPAELFDAEGNLLEIHEMPAKARKALAKIEIVEEFTGQGKDRKHIGYLKKMAFFDKNSAIDKAMKHLGLYEKDNKQQPNMLPPSIVVVGVRAGARAR